MGCLGGSQLKLSRGKYLLSAVKIFAARTIIESRDRGGSSEFLRGHGLDRTAPDPEPRFSSASSENQNPSSSLCSLFTDLQFRKNQRTLLSRKLPARPRNIYLLCASSLRSNFNKQNAKFNFVEN